MSETEQQYTDWTPEEGFDLSFLTIVRVAKATGQSSHGIKENVVNLLKTLSIEERVLVLEHMVKSKEKRQQKLSGATSL